MNLNSLSRQSSSSDILKARYSTELDHRMNLYEDDVPQSVHQQANSVACMINQSSQHLQKINGVYHFVNAPKLSDRYGQSVNFKDEMNPAFGTAYLAGPGLVLTAGHCVFKKNTYEVNAARVNSTMLIFGFYLSAPQIVAPLHESRICRIENVICASQNKEEGDWALLKLDKHPEGAVPLSFDFDNLVKKSTSIYMLGHPSGLPMKYTYGGDIIHVEESSPHFEAALDAYAGNSGSPVFDAITKKVIGILTAGNQDFVTVNGITQEYIVKSSEGGEKVQKITSLPDRVIKIILRKIPDVNLQQLVIGNQEISDVQLEVMVKKYIPKNTYKSIGVRTRPYNFAGDTVDTRIFTFSPSGNEFLQFFKGVRKFFFGFTGQTPHNYNTSITDQMARYLLGLPDFGNAEANIKTAFSGRREIYLFLSKDGKKFEARVEEDQSGHCSIS